ncbi:MAG: hypothetical protein QXY95_01810 [Thermosphaera sp.]
MLLHLSRASSWYSLREIFDSSGFRGRNLSSRSLPGSLSSTPRLLSLEWTIASLYGGIL